MSDGDIPADKEYLSNRAARTAGRKLVGLVQRHGDRDDGKSDGSVITDADRPLADQAALRGLLCRLWDLNLTLISVTRTENDAAVPYPKIVLKKELRIGWPSLGTGIGIEVNTKELDCSPGSKAQFTQDERRGSK